MGQPCKVKDYLEQVLHQVRYRRIHPELSKELENHIQDQKSAYMAEGLEEEEALTGALKQMGDPVVIGTQLDRAHRPRLEGSMVVLIVLLILAGMVLRFFSSPQVFDGLEYYYTQMGVTLLGSGLMFLLYTLDFTILGKLPRIIFFSLVALGILAFFISPLANGQYRFVTHILILFPTAFAGIIYSMRNQGYGGLVFCGLCFLAPAFMAILTPSLTSLLIISLSCLTLLTVAVAQGHFKVRKPIAYLMMYIPALTCLTILFSRIYHRLAMFSSPESDHGGTGYFLDFVVRNILASAKWIGQGNMPQGYEGMSIAQILPSINNDFLMTYTIHRFGWIAFFVVALLFAAFIIRATLLCLRQKSVLARLVSLSVVLTIALQVVCYMVPNLGLTLFAPLTLPLVSQGNSALLANMCLMGLILSVFRTGRFMRDPFGADKTKPSPFISYEDGRLIIDFKPHRPDPLS